MEGTEGRIGREMEEKGGEIGEGEKGGREGYDGGWSFTALKYFLSQKCGLLTEMSQKHDLLTEISVYITYTHMDGQKDHLLYAVKKVKVGCWWYATTKKTDCH